MSGKGSIPEDFSGFCAGDVEPSLGLEIHTLVEADKNYIVYLDNDLWVEYAWNDSYGPAPEGYGEIATRTTKLTNLSEILLGADRMESFRILLAEGMARLLGSKDLNAARKSLDDAEAYLRARGIERARSWLLLSSFLVAVSALAATVVLWALRTRVIAAIGIYGLEAATGALFGSLGALVSIIIRSREIEMDAAAGPRMHFLEAAARAIAGMVGALLMALAVKENLILGFINSVEHPFGVLLLLCILAGASERFVPSLIKHVEELQIGK